MGGKPREGFVKVPHANPMLSLDNALNEIELRDFDRRVGELLGGKPYRYVAELKMDGLSMSAIYKGGRFTQAVTRGDGTVGEDVTENARTIRSLPLAVAGKLEAFEVRGEAIMNRAAFERLNAERDERALPLRQPAQRRRRIAARAGAPGDRFPPPGLLHVFPAGRRRARL